MKLFLVAILSAWMAVALPQPFMAAARAAGAAVDHAPRLVPITLVSAKGRWHFSVELARSDAEKSRGLMFRKSLAVDGGMLFVSRHEQRVAMWMKNTFIPLDMLFIDRTGRIVNIAKNTKPQSLDVIAAAAPVLAVLEVAGGTADRLGLKPGDRVLGKFISAE